MNTLSLNLPTAYISFGSNVGDRLVHINQALQYLSEADGILVTKVSSLYETEPVGYEEQDWFLNGVVAVETGLSPRQLLKVLQQIEKRIGRQQRKRWGPREMDLDLLIFDQRCINTPDLIVPHPEMHQRRFVLIPFAEIAPDTIHPILRQNIRTLLDDLPTEKDVQFFAPPPF
ncbi:2-amino-4-hydroxy-6-hydroxymethyldihydropteridine diphosphokinase [Candidatus Poribacteria bacterium]|nr:2-amino-4-hydroxy-6-hydroxymethyldihydropteridine diphosphokinase [Candidatus Poribacteria bacterium]